MSTSPQSSCRPGCWERGGRKGKRRGASSKACISLQKTEKPALSLCAMMGKAPSAGGPGRQRQSCPAQAPSAAPGPAWQPERLLCVPRRDYTEAGSARPPAELPPGKRPLGPQSGPGPQGQPTLPITLARASSPRFPHPQQGGLRHQPCPWHIHARGVLHMPSRTVSAP